MGTLAIVYDGECRFCQWSVGRIRRLDRRGLFECVPRQTPGVDERFPALAEAGLDTGLRLVVGGDEVHAGADAVYEIYRRLPPFHLVAWTYRVPLLRGLLRAAFGVVARSRHRFGRARCDTGACAAPGSEAQG